MTSNEMHMTRDEFAGFVNESFDNGALATIHVLRGVLDELEQRIKAQELFDKESK